MNNIEFVRLIDDLDTAVDKKQLKDICEKLCKLLGADFFLFGVCDTETLTSPKLGVLSNYPKDWTDIYFSENLQKNDPVVNYCFENTVPIRWDQLIQSEGYSSAEHLKVMEKAKQYGLVNGISIPMKAPSGEIATLSLVVSDSNVFADGFTNRLASAQSFATRLLNNYLRINIESFAKQEVKLSSREKECIFWACEGKTAWEISTILNISERTAVFHLSSVMNKLNASNRQHAVAKAIMQGLVKPSL